MIGPVPPTYSVAVLGRQWLHEDVFVLTCSRPAGFSFLPGQYVILALAAGEREYTLLSAPAAPELRFLVKRIEGGQVSGALAELAPGAILGMGRAMGYLTYRPTDRPVVFVATGVGIAPFVAMVAAGVTGFTLLHGARTAGGLFFRQELSAAADRYVPCLSGEAEPGIALPALHQGRVTDYVDRTFRPGLYDFYLCGSRVMITEMTLLLDELCPEARVYSEAFG